MTDEEIRKLKDIKKMKVSEIEEVTGLSTGKIKHALRRARMKGNIEFEDMLTYTDKDVGEFIDAMRDMQKKKQRLDIKQVKACIRINETKPFGLAYSGDWHIGHDGVDYDLLDHELRTIRDTEGLYMLGAGDYRENAIKHKGSHFGEIIQPGMQDKIVVKYMADLSDKIIALQQGCHDTWESTQTDRSLMETLCEISNSVHLWHGGEITLKVEEEEYLLKCRHKFRFESSLNPDNAMRRLMEVFGPCDVASIAHLHNPHTTMRHLMGQYRIMVRSGSVKIWDSYGQQGGFGKGKPGVPVVIFFPDEHRMINFTHLKDGVQVLNALRK